MEVSLRSFCVRTMLVLVVLISVNAAEEKDEQKLRLKETQELLSSKNSSMADWYDDAWNEHIMEDPEEVAAMVDESIRNSTERRKLGFFSCVTGNPIDDCWRCDPHWQRHRKRLANCGIGFGRNAVGGRDGRYYVVSDPGDDDAVNPKPGTLRHAVIQDEPLWIVFKRDMVITPEIEQKVLDATDDAPWGPHGSAMAEIAQATKKFTECQMIMNVLWTRLGETGKDWRLVYKALTVIEYLVAHGSDRAVDDIIEHTFQISSLTSFEYVEPNGKDSGLNVRKKAETIVSLLNNKDKIYEVRNKAAANRDKYVGLSSSGISYKSSTASFGSSSSSFQSRDRYGGGLSGTGDEDSYDSFKQEKSRKDSYTKSHRRGTSDDQDSTLKKGSAGFGSKDQDNMSSRASKSSANLSASDKKNSVSSNYDDDDFDPRGTSSTKSASQTSNQVDLFGESLIGDLMDAPTSVPTEALVMNGNSAEVDLFADAAFVSAPPQAGKEASSQTQTKVDLFTSQPANPSAVPSTFDLFSSDEPVAQPGIKTPKSDPPNTNVFDPFAAVPMNNFDGSDLFGVFTSSSNPASSEPTQSPIKDGSLNNLDGKSLASSNPPQKEGFQVKSGIWADSLSRGLIDLNISAPKKVALVDVGVVGDLTDGLDEREKGPPTSFYMGRAMGMGSGLGKSGSMSSQPQATGGDDFFSSLGGQQYHFGNFK